MNSFAEPRGDEPGATLNLRHFRQTTGTSFKQWILEPKACIVRRRCSKPAKSAMHQIELVAQDAGFGTGRYPLGDANIFRLRFASSPSVYRRQFRESASADEALIGKRSI
ncbi:hypothetical protein ACTMU2_05265 [Cupriavidus basilensis]